VLPFDVPSRYAPANGVECIKFDEGRSLRCLSILDTIRSFRHTTEGLTHCFSIAITAEGSKTATLSMVAKSVIRLRMIVRIDSIDI
jgi:hypothetical protein